MCPNSVILRDSVLVGPVSQYSVVVSLSGLCTPMARLGYLCPGPQPPPPVLGSFVAPCALILDPCTTTTVVFSPCFADCMSRQHTQTQRCRRPAYDALADVPTLHDRIVVWFPDKPHPYAGSVINTKPALEVYLA